MDREEVEEIVNDAVRPLRWIMGLSRWTIHFEYRHVDDAMAQVTINPIAESATIVFDHDSHTSEVQAVETLFHELLHIALGDHEVAYNTAREYMEPREKQAFNEIQCMAIERGVCGIERLFYTLDMTPRKILRKAKRMMEGEA